MSPADRSPVHERDQHHHRPHHQQASPVSDRHRLGASPPHREAEQPPTAQRSPSTMHIILPPLQIDPNASHSSYGPRLPALEPRPTPSLQALLLPGGESGSQLLTPSFQRPPAHQPSQFTPANLTSAASPSVAPLPPPGHPHHHHQYQHPHHQHASPSSPSQQHPWPPVPGRERERSYPPPPHGVPFAHAGAAEPGRPAELRPVHKWLREGEQVELRIRQQPRAARACGFGERDRRVIDPPPLLEVIDVGEPRSPTASSTAHMTSVVNATLWDERGVEDVTFAQPQNRRTGGRLMGTLVASCIRASDEHGRPGHFFAFPDLSCRAYGKYRLRFSLVRISPGVDDIGSVAPILAHVMTDIFVVYSASEFPGMRPSSALTIALREQGTNIPIKKGKRSGLPAPGEEDEPMSDQDAPASNKREHEEED